MQLSKLSGCLLSFFIVVFVGSLSVKCKGFSMSGALDTRSTASKRKPGDTPATPLNISPESLQAIRDALSPDIERSNEYY